MSCSPEILRQWKQLTQKSSEWYQARKKIITASEVSSILELSPYETKYDLFQRKIKQRLETEHIEEEETNPALEWGVKHEPMARNLYKEAPLAPTIHDIHEVGLIHHPTYSFLGASPDGVVEGSDNKYWLLEIKCPYKRVFQEEEKTTPLYIWTQIQIQLEVCNLPFCHLLQCRYILGEKGNSRLVQKKLSTIVRNKEWFEKIALPEIQSFWDLLLRAEKYHSIPCPYPNPKQWISVKNFTGYLLDDPILDWLEVFKYEDGIQEIGEPNYNGSSKSRYDQKYALARSLLASIREYTNKTGEVINEITPLEEKNREAMSSRRFNQTCQILNSESAVLFRPVLMDKKRKIYGIPDMMVRSDMALSWLKKHYKSELLHGFHHLEENVDEVENSYILFCFSLKQPPKKYGDESKESEDMNPSMNKWNRVLQTQYTLYARIVDDILEQETSTTLCAFLGTNYATILNPYEYSDTIRSSVGAIKWAKDLKENGQAWATDLGGKQPPNVHLYPNMCNKYDQTWRHVKTILAERWGELTLLWYCGIAQRNRAHKNNVYTWNETGNHLTPSEVVDAMMAHEETVKKDEKSKRRRIMERMIKLNRTSDKIYHARKIGNLLEPYMDLQEEVQEFFVDFEVLPKAVEWQGKRGRQPDGMIYLNGMGWICPVTKEWKFKSFVAPSLSSGSEYKVIKEWYDTICSVRSQAKAKKAVLYHWSPAEPRFLNKAMTRHYIRGLQDEFETDGFEWRDLMEMFIDAEVVIRGVWGYSVKYVAKGLHKYGILPEVWKDGEKGGDPMIESGETTVGTASGCYRTANRDGIDVNHTAQFDSLRTYNEMDCRVMYDLLKFLRERIYSNSTMETLDPFMSSSPTAIWTSPSQTHGMPIPIEPLVLSNYKKAPSSRKRKRSRNNPYDVKGNSVAERVKKRRKRKRKLCFGSMNYFEDLNYDNLEN